MTEEETNKQEEGTEEKQKPEEKKQESGTSVVDDANEAAQRIEDANKEKKELLDREDAMIAKKALGGGSEAGMQPVKPKKLTDDEYATALEKGEVNPLEEDGFI